MKRGIVQPYQISNCLKNISAQLNELEIPNFFFGLAILYPRSAYKCEKVEVSSVLGLRHAGDAPCLPFLPLRYGSVRGDSDERAYKSEDNKTYGGGVS